jgi:hypothetical protein
MACIGGNCSVDSDCVTNTCGEGFCFECSSYEGDYCNGAACNNDDDCALGSCDIISKVCTSVE